ncbi:hypothetical protein BJF86_08905 [Serinicoccus sp. CNJ-927]|nr:hypothetical protein BJF86_08905 [Serinicoccus sp. CNJ-927]
MSTGRASTATSMVTTHDQTSSPGSALPRPAAAPTPRTPSTRAAASAVAAHGRSGEITSDRRTDPRPRPTAA